MDTLLADIEPDAPYVLAFCDGGYTTNLPLEDVIDGKAWVAFATTASLWIRSMAAPHDCSSRTSTSGRARSGCAAWRSGTRTSRASGRRTDTTSTGTRGSSSGSRATELADRHRRPSRRRDGSRAHARPRRSRVGGSPRRAAPRRPADRRGRLPRRARVLDRLGARRAGLDHRGAARRRRGLALSHRGAESRRRARAARADRRLLRLGAGERRPFAARRRRLRDRPAASDAAPPPESRQRRAGAPVSTRRARSAK